MTNPIVRMVLPKSRLNIPVRRTPLKDLSAMVKNAKTLLTRAVIGRVSPKCQSTEKVLMKPIKRKDSVMVLPKLQSTEEEVRRLSSKLPRNLDKVYEDRNDGA